MTTREFLDTVSTETQETIFPEFVKSIEDVAPRVKAEGVWVRDMMPFRQGTSGHPAYMERPHDETADGAYALIRVIFYTKDGQKRYDSAKPIEDHEAIEGAVIPPTATHFYEGGIGIPLPRLSECIAEGVDAALEKVRHTVVFAGKFYAQFIVDVYGLKEEVA